MYFNDTMVVVDIKIYLINDKEQDIEDIVDPDWHYIDMDINEGTENGWQAYIAYNMGLRSDGYITDILVMSHKNSYKPD